MPVGPLVAFAVSGPSRRSVSLLSVDSETLVVTRRQLLDRDQASHDFIAALGPAMIRVASHVEAALRDVARPVRLYALAEDGTLVSRPWSAQRETPRAHRENRGDATLDATVAAVLRARGVLLQIRPRPKGMSFATPASTSISAVAGSCRH